MVNCLFGEKQKAESRNCEMRGETSHGSTESRPTAARPAATESGIARRSQLNADEEFWNRTRRAQREKLCALCVLLFKPAFHICVNLRDLRANAFLSEFAAVQQLRQLAT